VFFSTPSGAAIRGAIEAAPSPLGAGRPPLLFKILFFCVLYKTSQEPKEMIFSI